MNIVDLGVGEPQVGLRLERGYDRVLRALEGRDHLVREPRDGDAMAQCPSHDDREPSLHVTDAEGTVLLHCFAGCEPEDVLAALDLTWRDLGVRARRVDSPSPTKAERTMVRIAERADQQQRIEADPTYWLRRAEEWGRVGSARAPWMAWACRAQAWVVSS